jgi:hypothetical protein
MRPKSKVVPPVDAAPARPPDVPAEDGDGTPAPAAHPPVTSLLDPRAIQMMSTEHWSLLSARALAYNEAFTRGGMFLTFLSMSFVAMALVASAMGFEGEFLAVTAIVLGFDLVLGLGTYGRIIAANHDDFRALHGMARIRHGYTEIAPILAPYFTTSIHDDVKGVLVSYGSPATTPIGQLTWALTTSAGMVGLIVSLLAGVFMLVVVLLLGLPVALGFGLAAVTVVGVFGSLAILTNRYFFRAQTKLTVMFPSPDGPVEEAPRHTRG